MVGNCLLFYDKIFSKISEVIAESVVMMTDSEKKIHKDLDLDGT